MQPDKLDTFRRDNNAGASGGAMDQPESKTAAGLKPADWRTLAEAVEQICLANGCEPEKAHGEIRGALAAGALPLRWADETEPPPSGDFHHPLRGHDRWIVAEIDWNGGTVVDDFELRVTEMPQARHRRLLVDRLALDALCRALDAFRLKASTRSSRSIEALAADERSRAMWRDYAQREFGKPEWTEWRVYSWLAYRTPSLICKIEKRDDLHVARHYSTLPMRDATPEMTLLRAIQGGKLRAFRDGAVLKRKHWRGKEPEQVNGVFFRRKDVLALWREATTPSPAGTEGEPMKEPEAAGASEVERSSLTKPGSTITEPPQTPSAEQLNEPTELQPRRRGAYRGLLAEWMAPKEIGNLRRMDPAGIAGDFKLYCERERPALLPLLPKRLRSMEPAIERIINRRMAAAKKPAPWAIKGQ
jgi:hypothetical protein